LRGRTWTPGPPYHCTGTVYGERYRAFRVADTAYLLKLILYIANNPVKAGLVSTERLFEVLGGTGDKGRTAYEELIRLNFVPVSQAPTQSAFQSERRSDQLQTILEEMLRGRVTVEIARFLNVTDRCVRGYRTETQEPGCTDALSPVPDKNSLPHELQTIASLGTIQQESRSG
jgi:hypothetical protein